MDTKDNANPALVDVVVEVEADADILPAISDLILSASEWIDLDQTAFRRSWLAARKAASKPKVQVLSVLIALLPGALAIHSTQNWLRVCLGLAALLIASPLGAICFLFPVALPQILLDQRDEARRTVKKLRRIIASRYGLIAARNELDSLLSVYVERVKESGGKKAPLTYAETATIRAEVEAALQRPEWAGARDELAADVLWPTPIDFDAGKGQLVLGNALHSIRNRIGKAGEPWRSLLS